MNFSFGTYYSINDKDATFKAWAIGLPNLMIYIFILFIRKVKLISICILVELIFWLIGLFYFKGGYAVGIGGSLDFIIEYDQLLLFFKLITLSYSALFLFKKDTYLNILLAFIILLLIAYQVVLIKFYDFTIPILFIIIVTQ